MGYLCAEIVLSLSSGREIVFRGSVGDDLPRFAARAREGEAIAALEFFEGRLATVFTAPCSQLATACTTAAEGSDAAARGGGSASGGAAPPWR